MRETIRRGVGVGRRQKFVRTRYFVVRMFGGTRRHGGPGGFKRKKKETVV